MLRPPVQVLATAVVVLLLSGCTAVEADGPAGARTERSSTAASSTVEVRVLLAELPVRQEGYGQRRFDREAFGYGGDLDPDGDGCWTRREVLIRDSVVPVRIGPSCVVTGRWRSSFDDRVTSDPDALTIDHTVPLLEAWRSGASTWDSQRLVAYGNDLGYVGSLQAVTAALNEDKGNSGPDRWLPPEHRCEYVGEWVAVKARWGLAADPAEVAAIERVLDGCGSPRIARPGEPDLDALT